MLTTRQMGNLLLKLKLSLPQWAPKDISQELAEVWLDALDGFEEEVVTAAFKTAASSLTEWPAPVVIKRLCQGTLLSDEQTGSDVAARIEDAISSCGYTNAGMARERIGELGWQVVQQSGGWTSVCSMTYDQLKTQRKTWRDTATIMMKKIGTTGENRPPEMPRISSEKTPLNPALRLLRESF